MSHFNSGFNSNISRNMVGGGSLFKSVTEQTQNMKSKSEYWKFDDKYPQYIQVQRIPAKISGNSITFKVNRFDPNTFLKSKSYIKLRSTIQKREVELDAKNDEIDNNPVNFDAEDRIYKKPGMVLHNSCTNARLRLNSHTMTYIDLRYITKKINTSFAGKRINNNYFSTSGSSYENYNGVYNKVGDIYKVNFLSADSESMPFRSLQFNVGAGLNNITWTQATNTITFLPGAGTAINLFSAQIFLPDDFIFLLSGESFRIINVLTITTLLASRQDLLAPGDVAQQDLVEGDNIIRQDASSYNGDDGRQEAYSAAFKYLNVGSPNSIFEFTEPLNFGPFNHLENYSAGEIYSKSWNLKQTKLIPYINELELSMDFKDIATNSLIYSYGRTFSDPAVGNGMTARLIDAGIVQSELTLFWVKPRDELLLSIPPTVRIQSWQYEHFTIDIGLINNEVSFPYNFNNIYTDQIPSYLLLYGMVNKDSESYICNALISDRDGNTMNETASIDKNAVETGMSPSLSNDMINSDLLIRSNTLGGDDILDNGYNEQELYRLTLKNSFPDFPYSDNIFKSNTTENSMLASYPSEFYLLLGERDLNSFFIRKGQTVKSYIIDISGNMTPLDGYSLRKNINIGSLNGGQKNYTMHLFYIYDRFFIELDKNGGIDARFDASFF